MELEITPRAATKPASRYLRERRCNVSSQAGEDGVIAAIFERIGARSRWCCEFGAGDGLAWSNTRTLIEDGWRAVLIEADGQKYDSLARRYAGRADVHTLRRYVGMNGQGLDVVLADTPMPHEFDLLSIDIDGCDWYVWQALENYRPRVVLIEFNPTIPNRVRFVQAPEHTVMIGASLAALAALARNKGYELAATTDLNAFFVCAEDFGALGIEDNSLDAVHDDDAFESIVFQNYLGQWVFARSVPMWTKP